MRSIIFVTFASVIINVQLAFGFRAARTEYTETEQAALAALRPLVTEFLLHNYMREDAFLFPFLEAVDFNVPKAVTMLRKSMEWRVQNHVDDVNSMERELPYGGYALDRSNRPTILLRIIDADFKKMLLTGRREVALELTWKLVESLKLRARELNVSQIVGILDMNGANFRQHGCSECIKFLQELGEAFDANYPRLAVAFIFINMPRLFEVALNVIKTVLTEAAKNVLHVYGYDRAEWTHALLEHFSPEQLNQLFGYKLDVQRLHNHNQVHQGHEKFATKDEGKAKNSEIGPSNTATELFSPAYITAVILPLMFF